MLSNGFLIFMLLNLSMDLLFNVLCMLFDMGLLGMFIILLMSNLSFHLNLVVFSFFSLFLCSELSLVRLLFCLNLFSGNFLSSRLSFHLFNMVSCRCLGNDLFFLFLDLLLDLLLHSLNLLLLLWGTGSPWTLDFLDPWLGL